MPTQAEKAAQFLALHQRQQIFVVANPWDAGTARLLTGLGFEALSTTSAGLAFVLGKSDGTGSVTRDEALANAKVIVLWGWDPTVAHQGPAHQFAWFVKLARERGKKVIIIDPRYSCAASTLADQWIPIKPGTDHAMFMAMANRSAVMGADLGATEALRRRRLNS